MPRKRGEFVVQERQVEDILATFTDITARLLGIFLPLRLLARQLALPDGSRLDLLFAAGRKLLLVELKVEACRKDFVRQIANYRRQVTAMQHQGQLPEGELVAYLLCPSFPEPMTALCQRAGILPIAYDLHHVLTSFFERFHPLVLPMDIKPRNLGLWHLGLAHRALYALSQPLTPQEVAQLVKLSSSTVSSYLTLMKELGLVVEHEAKVSLTEAGEIYVRLKEPEAPTSHISDAQAALIRRLVMENPFASGTVHGIFAIVECVMNLARNAYPVPIEMLRDYFALTVGNWSRWQHPKTRTDATLMYMHYAAQLGMLARFGQQVYLTPAGFRFVLLLQLHKALKLLDALERWESQHKEQIPPKPTASSPSAPSSYPLRPLGR
jgi:DNA-binding transcriptional ArsR family regulator